MEIVRLAAFQDNYIFLLVDHAAEICVAIDPGDGPVTLDYLQRYQLNLTAILITHHHHDHIGGNRLLLTHFPGAAVYASAVDEKKGRIPGQTQALNTGDRLRIFDRTAEVILLPGHTQGHIVYYFPPRDDEDSGELFCGDTLFANGCGRLLEGQPEQLFASLERLRQLPDKTRIWCAHEYTLTNIRFALTVNPENEALQRRFQQVSGQRQHREPTIPTVLGLEKQTNPFLRCSDRQLQKKLNTHAPLETFTELRRQRDLF